MKLRFVMATAFLATVAASAAAPLADAVTSPQHSPVGAVRYHLKVDTVRTSALGTSFLTPSGNIGCVESSMSLRCDIARKTWRAQFGQRPKCVMGIRGNALEMSATGRPYWLCHGDTALVPLGTRGVLAYGRTWQSGPFTCTSRNIGLTCSNRGSHGFFLSRQSYRRF